jgi:site-specific DNA recombinase
MKDGKIAVVEDEAEQVRLIYRRYLELSGVNALVRDLKERDVRTKKRLLATGATRGGIPFERGTLFYLLRNRFYIGEVRYKGDILPGEQPPIIGCALFDAVQQKLTDQWTTKTSIRNPNDHLLTGLLFDDAGYPMAPTHATKSGIRYRYYVSLPCLHGEAKTAKVGSVTRVPATDIEEIVVKSVNEYLRSQSGVPVITGHSAVAEVIDRIDVHKDRLAVRLRSRDNPRTTKLAGDIAPTDDASCPLPARAFPPRLPKAAAAWRICPSADHVEMCVTKGRGWQQGGCSSFGLQLARLAQPMEANFRFWYFSDVADLTDDVGSWG